MKKIPFYTILGLCFGLLSTSSCSESEDPQPAPVDVDVTQAIITAKQGTWRVTKYSDHGENEADHFTGYSFTFGDGDVLTATNANTGETHTGIWIISTTPIAPYQTAADQTPNDPVDFNIYFPETESTIFTDINDDWDFVSMSDSKMEFYDISPEDDKKPDKITFEKN